jgi:hypothetical protein
MESVTKNLVGLFSWVTDKGFQGLQSLNSSTQKAQEDLRAHGKSVLVKYNVVEELPKASEIKNIVLAILQPVETLEVTGVAATIGFYMASHVMPWPISWVCKAAMVGSAYFTFQIWQAKDVLPFRFGKPKMQFLKNFSFLKRVERGRFLKLNFLHTLII